MKLALPFLAFVLAAPLLGWSALMALDAQHADEERALDAQCTAALTAAGVEDGTARYPDIDRVCGPLLADAIARSETHGPMRDACLSAIGAREHPTEGVLAAFCGAVFPVSAWTGEQRLLLILRSATTTTGALLLALGFVLPLLFTLRGPRCLLP